MTAFPAWIMYVDGYDVWPEGVVSLETVAQLMGAPIEADDDGEARRVPGTGFMLQRLDVLPEMTLTEHPPMMEGRISGYWSVSQGRLLEQKTELISCATIVGLPDDAGSQPDPTERPQLEEQLWPFESNYTLGATYTVKGTNLDLVQLHFDEVKLHFLTDPAAYVIETWLQRGDRIAQALGFLVRPENRELADRMLARAAEIDHTRAVDVENPNGPPWRKATCSCNWRGHDYRSDGDLAADWAQHRIDTDPATIRTLLAEALAEEAADA